MEKTICKEFPSPLVRGRGEGKVFGWLLAALLLSACHGRDRLSTPTTVVRISPPAAAVKTATSKTFTAMVVTPGGQRLDVLPDWTLSPTSLGNLSPATGLQTSFTATGPLGTQGTLTATYNGISAVSQITIVPDTGNTATSYGFFTETLPTKILFGINNPTDPDGGFLGAFNGGGGTISLSSAGGPGEYTEGSVGLKASVSGTGGGSYAGYYMSFGYPDATGVRNDLSAFASGFVRFDLRAPSGADIRMKLESTPGSHEVLLANYVASDGFYHSYSIPMSDFTSSGVNLSQFETVTVTALGMSGSYDFYLDNLRFER